MDWKEYLRDSARNLGTFRKAHPDAAAGFTALHDAALHDGALSAKHKELQAIAIGIVKQCNDCIGFHMKAAIRAGATREEVVETISVAMAMGGGPAYMYGGKAIEAYDQLAS